MKSFLLVLNLFVFTFHLSASGVEPKVRPINTATSKIDWKGYKVLGSHNGDINIKSGSLVFEGDVLVGGEIVADMASINCTDLDGGGKQKLEGHLKSDDFFGVSTFPTASIKFTKVASRGKVGEYKIVANITIKGITKEIKFNANVLGGTGSASVKIDRSDFEIKYGSGSFFENLGDKTIYDEFDLDVQIKY